MTSPDDGYRLTYGGLDYLALHTHMKRSVLYSTGPCVGAGKESDIYICAQPKVSRSHSRAAEGDGEQVVLKIHRLGRISFRSIKNNRDYLRNRSSASWMYMSRLAAQKEFAFMQILAANGFSVPVPIAWSRHTVVMSLIEGEPLRAVKEVGDPAVLYADLIKIVLRFAHHGLIHGDFNEFNIMVRASSMAGDPPEQMAARAETSGVDVVVIDFPQTLSTSHPNAEFYFDRDIQCIKTFFERRFHFTSTEPGPSFAEAVASARKSGCPRLDVAVEASGFSKKMSKELFSYIETVASQEPDPVSDELPDDDDSSLNDGHLDIDEDGSDKGHLDRPDPENSSMSDLTLRDTSAIAVT